MKPYVLKHYMLMDEEEFDTQEEAMASRTQRESLCLETNLYMIGNTKPPQPKPPPGSKVFKCLCKPTKAAEEALKEMGLKPPTVLLETLAADKILESIENLKKMYEIMEKAAARGKDYDQAARMLHRKEALADLRRTVNLLRATPG